MISHAQNFWFRFLCEQLFLPVFSLSHDLIFQPAYVGSILAIRPQVLFVPDAFAWHYPKEIGLLRAFYWRIFIPISTWRAHRVLCCSEATAIDLRNFIGIPESKITVVYLAGGHLALEEQDENFVIRHNLDHRCFLLAVGFFKKIKNPFKILQAYDAYRNESKDPMPLVLVGGIHGRDAEAIVTKARSIEGVIIAGRLSDPELKSLYAHAAGLVFVSLYEGFGIPILEAQALECPVITSNNSSMPEVAGKGALLVDHEAVDEIASSMSRLHDPEVRASIILSGTENEAQFTWQKTADQILNNLNTRPI